MNIKVFFDHAEVERQNVSSVFALHMWRISHWTIASVKHFYLTDSCWSNLQKYTKSKLPSNWCHNTILLQYIYRRGCIYIIFHRDFCPRVGMCSTPTPTSKLHQILTQFTKSHQIHFDSHFDKILKIQAKINFLTI